ncbi:GIY-YIG nuclease family protein [Reinekea thalattae]|uniref:GIY-YIG nuclease family protein n=1 Tax=Reinekea thalattae TaxID=2593301 RepID=A0A5C8ZAW8_9GAMM|nr:GIY-YIG nuclease family protein [Reinekea thalattae]TXR54584.1 GIY-YIG nuclease family protein [Reinekea thalattae]
MWFVYLVRCSDQSLYTGITNNIERRLKQHNGLLAGGARYTAARRPVTLVYQEQAADRSQASKREYQLRKLSRDKKIQLIEDHAKGVHHGKTETPEA